MVIGISHEDKKKLHSMQKKETKITPRKNRMAVLSKKSKDKAFKKIDQSPLAKKMNAGVSVDTRVKLNDNYMRTGWYVPKGK